MRAWFLLLVCACSVDPPPAEPRFVHARFDPTAGVIPRPNDILRDATIPQLNIPEPDGTPAEKALVAAVNQLDAWPPELEASVEFDGVLDPSTVTADNFRVYRRTPRGPESVAVTVHGEPTLAPTKLVLKPTSGHWRPGQEYFIAALGGPDGLRGQGGEEVVADATFYYLRVQVPLTARPDVFPGSTPEERLANAERLEEIRQSLDPSFRHLENAGVPRSKIVAMWQFTTSGQVQLLLDRETQQMPLPSDFLRDPVTGQVDLPPRDDDSALRTRIKAALRELDGFGLSSNLSFELSAPIDPNTLTTENVRLYARKDGALLRIPISVRARLSDTAVSLTPERPLAPQTDHVVIISKGLRDTKGQPVRPMLPGLLAMLDTPVFEAGESKLGILDGESAAKVEFVRARTRTFLELTTEIEVAAAWSFRTMSIEPQLRAARDAAELFNLSPDPIEVREQSAFQAGLDFPLAALTLLRVEKVLSGYLTVPDFIDPLTRLKRPDGAWEPRRVRFTMTIPRGHDEDEPLPVAIFGHGLMTESRFVLALGDMLAGEGLAAIAIDLPFHGERTHCVWNGPQCLINPLDTAGAPICPNPCERGTMCSGDGRCVDSNGEGNALSQWPIVAFPQASGGAFLDVDHLDGSRDHFYQAITDLSALLRSLRKGNWAEHTGAAIDSEVVYAGQSLGGVIGSVFVAVHPDIPRAVFNVPGAGVIDLFRESQVFAPHFEALLARERIEPGSPDHEQLLTVARWIMDAIDPQNVAQYLQQQHFETGAPLDRTLLIQMATLDIVIPNSATLLLERLSGVPRQNYLAEHAFIVIPVEPAYLPGIIDLSRVLGRGELP